MRRARCLEAPSVPLPPEAKRSFPEVRGARLSVSVTMGGRAVSLLF